MAFLRFDLPTACGFFAQLKINRNDRNSITSMALLVNKTWKNLEQILPDEACVLQIERKTTKAAEKGKTHKIYSHPAKRKRRRNAFL